MRITARIASLAAVTLLFAGCQQNTTTVDPEVLAELRGRFVLADEPDGVEGILDVQESYDHPRDVVLLGQIGGTENPWSRGQASFVLADPVVLAEAGAGEPKHMCESPGCKFCEREQAQKQIAGLAVVSFVDQNERIVPIDARQLFDIKEKQMVVVRGRAEVNGAGSLVVLADGLYVRR